MGAEGGAALQGGTGLPASQVGGPDRGLYAEA